MGSDPVAELGGLRFANPPYVIQSVLAVSGRWCLAAAAVVGWRLADQFFEIRREVGLVVVAQRLRQDGEVDVRAVGQLVGGVEQAVAADDPLRTGADIVLEQQLQPAHTDTQLIGKLLDLRDVGMVFNCL